MKNMKIAVIVLAALSLSACSTLSGVGKDNAPAPTTLQNIHQQYTPMLMWHKDIGGGTDGLYLKVQPNVDANGQNLYVADPNKELTALNANTGEKLWRTKLATAPLSGPTVSDGIVVVSGKKNQLYAVNAENGKLLWNIATPNQVLSAPSVIPGTVLTKTVNGDLNAYSSANGAPLWQYFESVPVLELAGGSSPVVDQQKVLVGYADGKLAAFSLSNGTLLWERLMAQPQGSSPVSQMVDIAADPIVSQNVVYAVNYQGNLSAVDALSGQLIWQKSFSSYTSMALANNTLFVTDTDGNVFALNKANGNVLWEQAGLRYRILTAPTVMNDTIAVADGQGYVHWLSQANGNIVARVLVHKKDPIIAAPVVSNNHLYVLTSKGEVAGYNVK